MTRKTKADLLKEIAKQSDYIDELQQLRDERDVEARTVRSGNNKLVSKIESLSGALARLGRSYSELRGYTNSMLDDRQPTVQSKAGCPNCSYGAESSALPANFPLLPPELDSAEMGIEMNTASRERF